MKMLLRGVITNGTGKKAKKIGAFLAGKTGTTNEYRDAWFIGFSEDLVLGVWVGRDDNKHMGYRASGSSAALPIWVEVMKGWLRRQGVKSADSRAAARHYPGEGGFAIRPFAVHLVRG